MAFFSKVVEPARVTDSTVHFSLPEKAEAVMADLKDQKKALQERVIAIINQKAELLGRCPEKRDMSQEELVMVRRAFGKWIYALEVSGQRIPSETTLARRRNKKLKWKRKHRR